MKTKYEAMDGTIFENQKDCEAYEKSKNEFTIEYFDSFKNKIIDYCGCGDNFSLQTFIENAEAFRIISGVENWNNFIDENFSGLEDDIYYHYEAPTLKNEDLNEWYGYFSNGSLEKFSDLVFLVQQYSNKLIEIEKKLKN